ncbi:hypothetical protein L3Q72_22985 [Vibrio sp. JC009]|uniref:hypothetical protein n=1 Tax=Vibrio sp. JC009 TaxID=2912314 RepID=UPI0023AFB2B4|nr:hypothetical protein [Vibrio sp. JC009]WED24098.1 hypothetical protein L3Q72_22985 [Vibrio sp. JC009]
MDKKLVLSTAIALPILMSQMGVALAAAPWMNAENITQAFMDVEDANGDGKVTRDEFKGPDHDFKMFDKNGDGVIVLSEAPTRESMKKPGMNPKPNMDPNLKMMDKVTINGAEFKFDTKYAFFGWNDLPKDLSLEKQAIKTFTSPDGSTHYYQVVYMPDGNLNWFQAAYLADNAGGYLASITSEEENSFIFEMVNDMKYFWKFPAYVEGKSQRNHYEITIGPFLGGYQPEGSEEPAGGWSWLSGEKWDYSNWAVNLDDGVVDKDPRPNDQPNDSGSGQRIMGFGEMNLPVPTWGDYMDAVGTYGYDRLPGRTYAFIMEFEAMPK